MDFHGRVSLFLLTVSVIIQHVSAQNVNKTGSEFDTIPTANASDQPDRRLKLGDDEKHGNEPIVGPTTTPGLDIGNAVDIGNNAKYNETKVRYNEIGGRDNDEKNRKESPVGPTTTQGLDISKTVDINNDNVNYNGSEVNNNEFEGRDNEKGNQFANYSTINCDTESSGNENEVDKFLNEDVHNDENEVDSEDKINDKRGEVDDTKQNSDHKKSNANNPKRDGFKDSDQVMKLFRVAAITAGVCLLLLLLNFTQLIFVVKMFGKRQEHDVDLTNHDIPKIVVTKDGPSMQTFIEQDLENEETKLHESTTNIETVQSETMVDEMADFTTPNTEIGTEQPELTTKTITTESKLNTKIPNDNEWTVNNEIVEKEDARNESGSTEKSIMPKPTEPTTEILNHEKDGEPTINTATTDTDDHKECGATVKSTESIMESQTDGEVCLRGQDVWMSEAAAVDLGDFPPPPTTIM